MDKLVHLNEVNDVKIYSVDDEIFKSFGKVIKGYDVVDLIKYMETETSVPTSGNVYYPSINEMEEMPICKEISNSLYGGMPIQIGYCNGVNSTYNGFEYHKGSEYNIAVTDFMLVLGHSYDIEDNTYDINNAKVFYVPKGYMIEMYQTTLHLSPLKVSDDGFKDIVILPKGTNTPLEDKKCNAQDQENKLLLQRNKWVIAHPLREPLIKQGAHPGVIGENKELYY